jgi:hypothetical protein
MIWGRGVYRAVSRRYYAMGGYAVLHKYGPLLFHPSYSPPEKKRVCPYTTWHTPHKAAGLYHHLQSLCVLCV